MQNLTITNAGGFNANTFGFAGGTPWGYPETFSNRAYGPGAPGFSHGAGYGGWGSTGYLGTAAGQPYGSANAPTAPGSGARAGYEPNAYGPYGGGSVQIRASDMVAFSGLITANGGPGAAPNGGGSSGGGIYITCNTFIGDSNAVLRADGGMGSGTGGGGGSGGRIAVWCINDLSPSVVSASVSGAVGRSGTVYQATSDPGTIVWGWLPSAGTVIRFR